MRGCCLRHTLTLVLVSFTLSASLDARSSRGRFLTSAQAAAPQYLLIDLGTFWPFAITNQGDMAGSLVDPEQHAARGTATAVEPLELGWIAHAQHPSGLTVGEAGIPLTPDGSILAQEATAWDADGNPTPLGLWPGGRSSAATCISGAEIGGWGDDAQQIAWPLLFADGQLTQLATLGAGGYIDGCNGAQQRVGLVNTLEALVHAALWDADGTLHDLGTLGGVQSALAAINEPGEAVGWSTDATEHLQAVRWRAATGLQALAAPAGYVSCQALGLNTWGAIVGVCDPNLGYPATRAVLWAAGGGPGLDLNTLVVDSQGLTLTSARSLNDVGLIIGLGSTAQGERHGVLLVPAMLQNFARLWQRLGLPPLP